MLEIILLVAILVCVCGYGATLQHKLNEAQRNIKALEVRQAEMNNGLQCVRLDNMSWHCQHRDTLEELSNQLETIRTEQINNAL